jgi:hypothetical protein
VTPNRAVARVHAGTPELVRQAISLFADEIFTDLHALFQVPRPLEGRTPWFHFTIALALLSVLDGISRLLYDPLDRIKQHYTRFTGALLAAYPFELEPSSALTREEAADVLYRGLRNPFVHTLGISDRQGYERTIRLKRMHPFRVEELDRIASVNSPRPHWWPATITADQQKVDVHLECLYWGIRRMIYNLTYDVNRMADAESLLQSLERETPIHELIRSDLFVHAYVQADGMMIRGPNPILEWEDDPRFELTIDRD